MKDGSNSGKSSMERKQEQREEDQTKRERRKTKEAVRSVAVCRCQGEIEKIYASSLAGPRMDEAWQMTSRHSTCQRQPPAPIAQP